jgi:hypothetical protein
MRCAGSATGDEPTGAASASIVAPGLGMSVARRPLVGAARSAPPTAAQIGAASNDNTSGRAFI